MPLVTGARLGAYEVVALIGQGGMGEVHRARDTKLDRDGMRWNPDGKELFYLAPDRTVMSVEMTGNANAPTALPKPLFKPAGIERASQAGIATFSWAVSPDGKRFLFPIPLAGDAPTPPLTVVLNWTSLLNQ